MTKKRPKDQDQDFETWVSRPRLKSWEPQLWVWYSRRTVSYLTDVLQGLDEVVLDVEFKVDPFPGETVFRLTTRQQSLTTDTQRQMIN